MQNINVKRYLNRYLGIGLPVVLVLAALFVPQGWFALRDAASADRVHGETLSPLMVAQLDSSYESDIHDRMSACLEAIASQDVLCSSKEVDPGNEALRENIELADRSILMGTLIYDQLMASPEKQGLDSAIVSCTQYVLMRQSDGQILLVANDIHMVKSDGWHMELLLDGVDGTIYYLENEEYASRPSMRKWMEGYGAWNWWWILNDTYYTEEVKRLNDYYDREDAEISAYNASISYDPYIQKVDKQDGYILITRYTEYGEIIDELFFTEDEVEALKAEGKWAFEGGNPNIWVSSVMNKETYCCLLTFGEISDSWTMEVEEDEEGLLCWIRLGLPSVIRAIPEMAQRISLAEYDQIYQRDYTD